MQKSVDSEEFFPRSPWRHTRSEEVRSTHMNTKPASSSIKQYHSSNDQCTISDLQVTSESQCHKDGDRKPAKRSMYSCIAFQRSSERQSSVNTMSHTVKVKAASFISMPSQTHCQGQYLFTVHQPAPCKHPNLSSRAFSRLFQCTYMTKLCLQTPILSAISLVHKISFPSFLNSMMFVMSFHFMDQSVPETSFYAHIPITQ